MSTRAPRLLTSQARFLPPSLRGCFPTQVYSQYGSVGSGGLPPLPPLPRRQPPPHARDSAAGTIGDGKDLLLVDFVLDAVLLAPRDRQRTEGGGIGSAPRKDARQSPVRR